MQLCHKCRRHGGTGRIAHPPGRVAHPHCGPGSSAAESFRRLRLRLARALSAHPAKSLAVTSLAPGDCGPVVAINLALVLAEAGSSVLLVDADARAGQIASHFGMDSQLGLTTVIGEETLPESAFQQYHENLRILPAGSPSSGRRTALAGPAG